MYLPFRFYFYSCVFSICGRNTYFRRCMEESVNTLPITCDFSLFLVFFSFIKFYFGIAKDHLEEF
jgi:hypothetical protein